MSVLPLYLDGDKPTVVNERESFDLEGQAVLIQNFDHLQLSPDSDDCNISYDLRIGERYRDHRDRDGRPLGNDAEIVLKPGMAVIIETEEWVHFPKLTFGQIAPKVSLLQKGISNTPSKVDPGYNGRLLITAFNHGKRSVSLKRNQRFCSLFISTVGDRVRPYDKPGKQIAGHSVHGRLRRILDWLEANASGVMAVQIVATTLLVIATIASYFVRLAQ